MSTAATRTRSRTKRRTTAWPMPLAAPVTRATRPSSPLSCICVRASRHVTGAVDVERDAGHVAGLVGAEGDHESGDLVDGRKSAERDPRRHALWPPIAADRRHEPGLGDRVRTAAALAPRREALPGCDRREVDDRAPAGGPKVRGRCAGAV